MKILVGSFQCESNTFCRTRAETEDFEVFYNEEVLQKLAAVKIFHDMHAVIVPMIFASALPSGMVSKDAFEYYRDEFLEIIQDHTDADGIYLYLHGAMYVETIGSGEEALVKAIREVIGYNIPISTALDFHGNLSDDFIKNVNAIQGFRTAPHTDHDDTEYRAAKSLIKCIENKVTPIPRKVRIPFLGGDASITSREPFCKITETLLQLDRKKEIISAAFFNGQPWYDSEYTGNCAVVSSMDLSALEEALVLARMFWDGREHLTLTDALSPESAVELSLQTEDKFIFVTDSGDNTTAGANGAGTLLLNRYMEKEAKNVLICGIFDQKTTNSLLEETLGTKTEIILCEGRKEKQEIETRLTILLKSKGTVYGWAGDEVGEGVCVTYEGIDIVLTNARAAFTTPEHFHKMGIKTTDYKVIVLKMGYLFPKLKEISQSVIFALTPGISTNDFTQLDYKKLKRKMYPIDKEITWEDIVKEVTYETDIAGS